MIADFSSIMRIAPCYNNSMLLKNKTILVTGADGFIGSHLTEALVKDNCKVKALSYYNSFNSWGWLEDINCLRDIEVLTGDVRDPHYCKKITIIVFFLEQGIWCGLSRLEIHL